MPKGRTKYGNVKTLCCGITFDSKREADRFLQLRLLEKAGEITNLELQPRYVFVIDGRPVRIRSNGYPSGRQAIYSADFRYVDKRKGRTVVEDVKSKATLTEAYKLRKALVECLWPGTIVEEV